MKFIDFILIMLVVLACFYFLEGASNAPVVYWSTSKNECVKVEINGRGCDCENIPEIHKRIWVK